MSIKIWRKLKMKCNGTKQSHVVKDGKRISKERLAKVRKAVECRDEPTLKQLNSPSMWG
jgi:PP-loop superfamily ATP-utilizing enzyme